MTLDIVLHFYNSDQSLQEVDLDTGQYNQGVNDYASFIHTVERPFFDAGFEQWNNVGEWPYNACLVFTPSLDTCVTFTVDRTPADIAHRSDAFKRGHNLKTTGWHLVQIDVNGFEFTDTVDAGEFIDYFVKHDGNLPSGLDINQFKQCEQLTEKDA